MPAGPDFRLVNTRLWSVEENGGYHDGPSVHCGEKRELWVIVLDAAGNPINGVTVKSGTQPYEEQVTGHKPERGGAAELVLGEAKEVYIIRDVDGREVSSDRAWVSTIPRDIPQEALIAAGYCTNADDCAQHQLVGCAHHYSWDVTFQRSY